MLAISFYNQALKGATYSGKEVVQAYVPIFHQIELIELTYESIKNGSNNNNSLCAGSHMWATCCVRSRMCATCCIGSHMCATCVGSHVCATCCVGSHMCATCCVKSNMCVTCCVGSHVSHVVTRAYRWEFVLIAGWFLLVLIFKETCQLFDCSLVRRPESWVVLLTATS